jgi:hypothetical protein
MPLTSFIAGLLLLPDILDGGSEEARREAESNECLIGIAEAISQEAAQILETEEKRMKVRRGRSTLLYRSPRTTRAGCYDGESGSEE